jgi:phospho-N-acetylmuramoyl-pentapeptide-transferase
VRSVLIAALTSLLVSITATPLAIRTFKRRGYGQEIREDGPTSHQTKRGTPTMGGTVIIAATLAGYGVAHAVNMGPGRGPTASALLVLFLMTGLGLVGFLDDYIKIVKQRSLGLKSRAKLAGQSIVSVVFAVLALRFRNHSGLAPASRSVSFLRDSNIVFATGAVGTVLFVLWAYVMISAAANGVNLTDGLDGLASGAAVMVFMAYVVIAFWQFGNSCALPGVDLAGCYNARDPLDVSIVAVAAMGACFGFLWWNASPAKIFMGDTGSLAIGGAMAGISIVTRTELLLVVLGGLFVVETLSVILQVAGFKLSRKRLFNMAPIHHHFELAGWVENTVIVRFWIVGGLAVAFGLGVFYAEFISHGTAS